MLQGACPQELLFLVCCLGTFFFYFIYGIVQERLSTEKFGPSEERFTFTAFLLFIQCVGNCIVSYGATRVLKSSLRKTRTPLHLYLALALFYVGAMFCSNKAILYIEYHTQVLAKACKPIPVIIVSMIVGGKRYPLLRIFYVFVITVGVTAFLLDKSSGFHQASPSMNGAILLILSLGCDGLTCTVQDHITERFQTSSQQLMFYANAFSALIMFIAMLVTQELLAALVFCMRYPLAIVFVVCFASVSALGQCFVYTTITEFGSLTINLVTTTRKFATILFSVLWFEHYISFRQWIAVITVFSGISLDLLRARLNRSQLASLNG